VAQISGVVTIIAATVYALGVFTLVLPIVNSYNSTFAAAWYTTSVVPKTVVVGHGVKSLVSPSLALTLATTLFALTMLWVMYIISIGWRHARAATESPALSPFSMVKIYALLSVLTFTIGAAVSVVWVGWEATFSSAPESSGIADYVNGVVLAYLIILALALSVLSFSAAAVFVVARSLRSMRRLIKSRTFPSMSWRDFIYKGLAFTVLSSVFLACAATLSVGILYSNAAYDNPIPDWSLPALLSIGSVISSVLVVLFGLAVALSLMLRLLRYIRKAHLFREARRSNFTPVFVPLKDLSTSLAQRARRVAPTVLYSMVLFLVLYLALFVAVHTLGYLIFPLVDEVRADIKSETWLDQVFVPLVVFGALVSGVIMYRKDWRNLGSHEGSLLARGSWRHFLMGLLKSVGARSLRRGLILGLAVAYVVALASAFLLARLNPPPLPKVEVNEVVAQGQNGQSGQEPAFQGQELALLAHTEGYWYLIDEGENDLLIVPDQTDKYIRLRLDEQPK